MYSVFYVLNTVLCIDILLCISPRMLNKHEEPQVRGYPIESRNRVL